MVSGLDGPDLLHAFYTWSCREFSEPAPIAPAFLTPTMAEEDKGEWDGGVWGGGVAAAGPVPDVRMHDNQPKIEGHRHDPLEELDYEGSLQLYFRKRNLAVAEAADVSQGGV